MAQTRVQGVRGARNFRVGKVIRTVPRIISRRFTPPLLLLTSKHLSKRGLYEPSQLLAKALEKKIAECDTESPLCADYADYTTGQTARTARTARTAQTTPSTQQ